MRTNNTGDNEDFQFCIDHTCHFPQCLDRSTMAGGYCEQHGCRVPECHLRATERHSYCIYHECQDSDCHSLSKLPRGFCQAVHSCDQDGCAQRRGAGGPYPQLCARHAEVAIHQDGVMEGRYGGRQQWTQREQQEEEERLRNEERRQRRAGLGWLGDWGWT